MPETKETPYKPPLFIHLGQFTYEWECNILRPAKLSSNGPYFKVLTSGEHLVGAPHPTGSYTSEQLRAMGLIAVYKRHKRTARGEAISI